MARYLEMIFKVLILTLLIIHECVGPPTKQKEAGQANQNSSSSEGGGGSLDDIGVEYSRYLKEVVEALESDAEFRKKLELAEEADFRSGKVAAELEFVNHKVRTKLDELKRTELQRLKQLVKENDKLEKQQNGHNDIAGHLDHSNEHTFEVPDLHRLITKVRLDLEEADKMRRQQFKEYEMQKKFEEEQKLKAMDEEHKKKYKEDMEAQKKKHQQHEPIHHPGSKAQLEEVWEKEDHMENQKFNPRAFFHLHDLDGNGYWDEEEVKALFLKEVQKLYEPGAPESDLRDRQEEMERMREHVFAESDTNRDRLISFPEFLEQTKKKEFERDDGWESIDQRPQFTQEEYEEFERRRQEEIQRLIEKGLLQPYAPGMMPPQYGVHPGQFQQHPGQGAYIQPPHPGMNPNQMPQYQYGGQVQHPNQIPQQQQYVQVPHPGQIPQQQQYHQGVPANQIPNHPNQPPVQYQQHPVPVQQQQHQQPQQQQHQQPQQLHPNQIPQHQQPQQNQIPVQQSNNQIPQQQQFKTNTNEVPQQINQQQQVPPVQQINQMQQQNQPAQPQPPQYQQQPQANNIPQYQSKYEPHSNKVASNEKNLNNVPK